MNKGDDLMQTKQDARTRLKAELTKRAPHLDSAHVVDSMCVGLTHLRELMLARVHEDVERHLGVDSMIAPVSARAEKQQSDQAQVELEIYSSIVLADEVVRHEYVAEAGSWLRDEIFRLRLGDDFQELCQERVDFYCSRSVEDRRLKFLTMLQRAIPESARTPLVLFRLFPRAIRIVAAVAFGDPLRAQELRSEQCRFLPAVSDCVECHGRVLDNDEICDICGNPVWKFAWLESD